jgi:hypothetical protein
VYAAERDVKRKPGNVAVGRACHRDWRREINHPGNQHDRKCNGSNETGRAVVARGMIAGARVDGYGFRAASSADDKCAERIVGE